jgi:hypothetical protein
VRRCVACNTCVDGMRAGQRLGCLVNPTTGRERAFAEASPPQGERICVVGAGPAGLSYASLVADGNQVTVLERAPAPGGALRYAGKAPLFQEVEAREAPLLTYIAELERACREAGVAFRYGVDVRRDPSLLAPFDRVVFATGARYRFGLGALVPALLDAGCGRWPGLRRLFASPRLRDWFYTSARRATAGAMRALAHPGQTVLVIGDAAQAGKAKEAITSAFEAALLGGKQVAERTLTR